MKKHQPWNHQPFFLWLTCTTNQTLAVGCGTRKSTGSSGILEAMHCTPYAQKTPFSDTRAMLGTGILLCRFPVVSWHVTAPKVHLDWMWHWKMARSNATRTELYRALSWRIEKQRETRTDCTEHWFLAASPFSDRLFAVGAGDSRWLASSGFSFCWTIILRRHVQSFRIRFLLCYLMRAKKSCLKCWKHLRILLPHNCIFTTDLFMIVCHSLNLKKVELGSSGGLAFVSSLFQQPQTCLYEMWNHCEIYFTSQCLDRQTIHM